MEKPGCFHVTQPLEEIKASLDFASAQWDQALARLKAFVEDPGPSEV